jgi:hypothetical protein
MESHDEERLMFKNISFGDATGDYDTRNLKVALKRMQLDALFFLTIPGPKMIWQFGELGYDVSIDENGRTGEKPIKWDYYSDENRHQLYLTYKFLNDLRKSQPAFSTSGYSYSLSTPAKRLTLAGETMKVNILGNFGMVSSTINLAFPQTGKWYEYFTRDSLTVTNTNSLFTFKPGEFRLYTTKKLAPSELVTGVDDQISENEGQRIAVYPNPSDKEFSFKLQGTGSGMVSVNIYNLTGLIIRHLENPDSIDGTQIIKWDGMTDNGSEAPAGLYLVNIRTHQKTQSARLLKIK